MKRLSIFVGILALIITFHLYQLNSIPPGLSNDEANIGYEAWSIATTGKDQWGDALPAVFEGFGNWSLPVYIYLLSPLIKIFGPTIVAVRLLSLISVVTLSGFSYVLLRELRKTPHDWLAVVASVFVGFTPWIFGLSRTANEATLAVAFFVAGLVFFLRAQQRKGSMISPVVLFSLAALTYYGMWVFIPLFLFTIVVIVRKSLVVSTKDRIAGGAIIAVLISVLVLISFRQGGNKRLNQVNIFNDPALVGVLNQKRGSCVEMYPNVLCQLFFNKPTTYGATYISNYASHFSLREWFIFNSAPGILPQGGFFLLIQAPLFLIGLWFIVRRGNSMEKSVYLSWILLAPLADSLTGPGNFTRSFILAPVIPLVGSYSLFMLSKKLRAIVLLVFAFSWMGFFLSYTSLFPKANSIYTHFEYQPLMEYMRGEKLPIYLSSRFRDTKQYVFLLFYNRMLPRSFQQDRTVIFEKETDGWIWVKQLDNWHFTKSIPIIGDLPSDSVLIGASKEEIEPFVKQYQPCLGIQLHPKNTIYYLTGDPAFSVLEVKKTGEMTCPEPKTP
ncbi:glycosyltransferase family 39 protein [Candidatus Jorgensenbacteria bacterium]|nr:glycosyltransferase family 39 protein [Candidatus Jorgensenbacteria bacterium]